MSRGRSSRGAGSVPLVPILLGLLALLDLEIEIRLLLDHFTLTALVTALRSHPLATVTLLLLPSLWRHYGRDAL